MTTFPAKINVEPARITVHGCTRDSPDRIGTSSATCMRHQVAIPFEVNGYMGIIVHT